MDVTDNQRKNVLMMHYAGTEVNQIYETLSVPVPGEGENVFDKAVAALTEHFSPEVDIEIMKFRKIKQQPSESIMDFYTRLKQGAALCGFADKDKEIRHQLMS